ncbi:MAG: DUF3313 domain-containing protein [Candidatus Binatia bacterium]
MTRSAVAALLALALTGCMAGHHVRSGVQPSEMSGFLDDYSLLRAGGTGELTLVYRNPDVDWRSYDQVLLEAVAIWRSGKKSLDPVPEADLLRLASDFNAAVRARLGEGYQVVDRPGPGVMRIRLAITDARATDPILDVLTAPGADAIPHPGGAGPLDPETKRFLAGAAIEGEIRDAQSGALLAQGVDRPRRAASIDTWADLDHALAFWADRACDRLEARTGRR